MYNKTNQSDTSMIKNITPKVIYTNYQDIFSLLLWSFASDDDDQRIHHTQVFGWVDIVVTQVMNCNQKHSDGNKEKKRGTSRDWKKNKTNYN